MSSLSGLQSLKRDMALVSIKEFPDIQATIACRFTLKRDMIITNSRFAVFIEQIS